MLSSQYFFLKKNVLNLIILSQTIFLVVTHVIFGSVKLIMVIPKLKQNTNLNNHALHISCQVMNTPFVDRTKLNLLKE
jgi:hypothetical protein